MKKFKYKSITEDKYNTTYTTTTIFADIPAEAAQIIGEAEKWDGNDLERPDVIYTESKGGTVPTPLCLSLIRALDAKEWRPTDE